MTNEDKGKDKDFIPDFQGSGSSRFADVPFGLIKRGEGDTDFAIRDIEKYATDKIKDLAYSIAQDGLLVPLKVYEVDVNGKKVYSLIDGHRRFSAISFLIQERVARFTNETEFRVEIIEGASVVDMYISAVTANSQREGLSENEALKSIVRFQLDGVDNSRARYALSMTPSTFARYKKLADCDWLRQAIRDGFIKVTHAGKLLDEAEKYKRVEYLKTEFGKWVDETKYQIRRKKDELAKAGKKMAENKMIVSSYLKDSMVSVWCAEFEKMNPGSFINTEVVTKFGVVLDGNKVGTPKLDLDLSKASSEDLKKFSAEAAKLRTILTQAYAKRKKEERLTAVSDEDLLKAEQEIDEAEAKLREAEAGRKPEPVVEQVPPVEDRNLIEDVEDAISEDDETEEE